MLVVDNSCESF